MCEKKNILTRMAVIATLVVGADGSTMKDGSSQGVTSGADRANFLAHRKLADCIIIGGNTARTEPYLHTPVPVIVISRGDENPLAANPLAHFWNLSPVAALDRAIATFGPRVHIEAGASLITELISEGRIDQLVLSVTQVVGGEKRVNIESLLQGFTRIDESESEGTRFISASK
jgi:riboflavin biosynthesis pyrimidine reductase